jgi:hypothetical protein
MDKPLLGKDESSYISSSLPMPLPHSGGSDQRLHPEPSSLSEDDFLAEISSSTEQYTTDQLRYHHVQYFKQLRKWTFEVHAANQSRFRFRLKKLGISTPTILAQEKSHQLQTDVAMALIEAAEDQTPSLNIAVRPPSSMSRGSPSPYRVPIQGSGPNPPMIGFNMVKEATRMDVGSSSDRNTRGNEDISKQEADKLQDGDVYENEGAKRARKGEENATSPVQLVGEPMPAPGLTVASPFVPHSALQEASSAPVVEKDKFIVKKRRRSGD